MKNTILTPPALIVMLGLLIGRTILSAEDGSTTPLRISKHAGGFEFRDGEKPVLFYQAKPKSLDGRFERASYVHPLYNLDGKIISEDFPVDHLHHRGIFWAWHQLYIGDIRIGDPWICRNFLTRVDEVEIVGRSGNTAAILATSHWVSPDWLDASGAQKPVVREETQIEVWPEQENSRVIDFRIKLTALEQEVRIGGSDDVKGYGGFSPRLQLPTDIRFTAESGEVEPQKIAIDSSPWMDISGTFGEANGNRKNSTSGVTILCHPSLPGFPQKWILRRARSMQNPVYPGRTPVKLPTKEPLELRYRLVVHRGRASKEQLSNWFETYVAEK